MAAVRLDPMASDEFDRYYESEVGNYAAAQVRAGLWTEEESIAKSQESTRTLLPQGLATENHFFYTVRDDAADAAVGVLWVALRPRAGGSELYIYSVLVHEQFRGRGYGRATMEATAAKAKELGASQVGLNVFDFNKAARQLYQSLGYRDNAHLMSLDV